MYWYQDWQWRRPRKTWGIRRCLFLVTHYELFLLSIINPWIVTGSPTTLLIAFRSLDKDLAGLKNLAKFEALNVKTRHARDQLRQDASCSDCNHVRICPSSVSIFNLELNPKLRKLLLEPCSGLNDLIFFFSAQSARHIVPAVPTAIIANTAMDGGLLAADFAASTAEWKLEPTCLPKLTNKSQKDLLIRDISYIQLQCSFIWNDWNPWM